MFTAQSAAIAAGAIPVFLYGRRRLGSEWLALIGAGTYLLHPAVGWTNLENFHPDAFLGVFVGFAIYGALERKWRLYARLRGPVAAGEGGRVTGDRAARHLGCAAARSPDRAADRVREHRLHGGRDAARDAQPDRRADTQWMAHPVRRPVGTRRHDGDQSDGARTASSQRWSAVVPGADDGAVRLAVRPVARCGDDQRVGAVHQHPEHVLVPVPDRLPLQPRRGAGTGDRHAVRDRSDAQSRRVGARPSSGDTDALAGDDDTRRCVAGDGVAVGAVTARAHRLVVRRSQQHLRHVGARVARRHPGRCGRVGELPPDAAIGLPRGDLPVPGSVPRRAVRAGHRASKDRVSTNAPSASST